LVPAEPPGRLELHGVTPAAGRFSRHGLRRGSRRAATVAPREGAFAA